MEDFIKPVETAISGTAPLVPTSSTAFDNGYGVMDLLQQEFENESFLGMAISDSGPEGVPDASFDRDKAKENLRGQIHPDFIDSLGDRAVSQTHLDALMPLWTEKSDRQFYLESQGIVTGLGLGIGAEVTNLPVYIGAALLLPETLAVVSATWGTRFIASLTGEALATTAKDLVGDHNKDQYDYIFNSLFAGVFGSVLGRNIQNADAVFANEVKKQSGVTPEVESLIKANPEEKERIIREAYEARNNEIVTRSLYDEIDEAIEYSSSNVIHKALSAVRQDMAAVTARSESETLSSFSQAFFPDPTAKNLNKDAPDLATSFERVKAVMFADLLSSFNNLEREFADLVKKNEDGMLSAGATGAADTRYSNLYGTVQAMRSLGMPGGLDEMVEAAIKKNGYGKSEALSAIVKKGVLAAEKLVLKQHQTLKDSGMKKFGDDGIKPNPNYMHIVHDRGYMTRLRAQGVTPSQVATAISNSMRKGLEAKGIDVDEELLRVIGFRFYNSMTDSKIDSGKTFNNMLDDMLKDQSIDSVTRNKILGMKNSVPYSKEKGIGKATETRTTLDYSHVETVKVDGKEIDINIFDIVSKDFKASANAYIRKMAGASVLEKTKWNQKIKPLSKEDRIALVEQSPEMVKAREDLQAIESTKSDLVNAQRVLDGLLDNLLTAKDKNALQKLITDNQDIVDKLLASVDTEPKLKQNIEDIRRVLMDEAGLSINAEFKVKELVPTLNNIINLNNKLAKFGKLSSADSKKLASLVKIRDGVYADMKKQSPKKFEEIKSIADEVALIFNRSGFELRKSSDLEFQKRFPDNKLDRRTSAYKEIYAAKKKKSDVALDSQNERISKLDAFKQITSADRSLSTTKDVSDFVTQIEQEINEKISTGVYTASKGKKELVRINTVLKELQGIPTAQAPDGFMQQANRIFQNVNIGRLLTQTVFTMGGEVASVGMETGYKSMLKSFPQVKSVLGAYRNGSISDKSMAEIQEFTGLFNEMYQTPRVYEQAHEYSPTGTADKRGAMDWIESKSEAFAEFTLMMGGIKPMTAATRAAYAQGAMNKMRNGALGKNTDTVNYKKMMHEFGFSKNTEEAIYAEIRKHDNGTMMNFKDWDVETRNLFLDGITRKADMVIQKKNIGDRMGWVLGDSDYILEDTVMGKVVMSLKSFALTAFTKQAGRLAGRADMFAALTIASQLALGSIMYTAKSSLNYAGNQDKLDEALEPKNVMSATIGMIPLASLFPQAIDAGSTMVTGKPVFGHTRNSGQITDQFSSLPAIDLLNQLLNVAGIPQKGIKKGFDDISVYDPLLKISGAGGYIGAKTLSESLRD